MKSTQIVNTLNFFEELLYYIQKEIFILRSMLVSAVLDNAGDGLLLFSSVMTSIRLFPSFW